jgi:hypothetical protein
MFSEFLPYLGSLWCEVSGQECCVSCKFDVRCYKRLNTCLFCNGIGTRADGPVRNNHAMDMSLCHGGVLVEHECVCESRRVCVRRVGACRTIVESGREREFVPPQPLVIWG